MLKFLRSRTVWTLIVLFVINGVSGIRESIPANTLTVVDAVLALLASYFRLAPKQEFGGQRKFNG